MVVLEHEGLLGSMLAIVGADPPRSLSSAGVQESPYETWICGLEGLEPREPRCRHKWSWPAHTPKGSRYDHSPYLEPKVRIWQPLQAQSRYYGATWILGEKLPDSTKIPGYEVYLAVRSHCPSPSHSMIRQLGTIYQVHAYLLGRKILR